VNVPTINEENVPRETIDLKANAAGLRRRYFALPRPQASSAAPEMVKFSRVKESRSNRLTKLSGYLLKSENLHSNKPVNAIVWAHG